MQKIRQYLQSIDFNREYISWQFFLASAILTLTFFLLFINIFKTYAASVTILVSAKSEIAATVQKQIVDNISEFPKSLAFYDRFLKYNPEVQDIAEGKTSTERKTLWNKVFSVQKASKDSSLIEISIRSKNQDDAEYLAQKITRTLFDFSAFYYNIKNDIDLRIIDGPISYVNTVEYFWFFLISLFFGIWLSFFGRFIFAKLKKRSDEMLNILKENNTFNFTKEIPKSKEDALESLENLYTAQPAEDFLTENLQKDTVKNMLAKDLEIKPEKIQEMKRLTKIMEPDRYPNFPETDRYKQVQASAPDNLPIADDSFFAESPRQTSLPEQAMISQPAELEKEEIHKNEPTAEQLKERLNKLLKGEI